MKTRHLSTWPGNCWVIGIDQQSSTLPQISIILYVMCISVSQQIVRTHVTYQNKVFYFLFFIFYCINIKMKNISWYFWWLSQFLTLSVMRKHPGNNSNCNAEGMLSTPAHYKGWLHLSCVFWLLWTRTVPLTVHISLICEEATHLADGGKNVGQQCLNVCHSLQNWM